MRSMRMEHKVLGVFLLMFIGLLGSAVFAFISTHRLIDTASWVSHTYAVMGRIQATRAATQETQSALYRYTITGDYRFLEKMQSAVSDLQTDYAQLRKLTDDSRIQQGNLDHLAGIIKDWKSRTANIQHAKSIKGFIAAQTLVEARYVTGNTTIIPVLDAMDTEERRLLSLRLSEEQHWINVVDAVYLLLCSLTIVIALGLYMQVRGEVRTRRQFENKFQMLFESAADAIILSDVQGQIVMVNNEVENMFAYPGHELIGLAIDTLLPERVCTRHRQHRAGYIAAPKTRRMGVGLELFARRKDGSEFPVDISLSPLSTEEGMLVVSRIRDMTQRQDTENRIRELNMHLQQRTVELEAVNKELEGFSYSVSHDLRAPLRAVDGFSRLLEEQASMQLDAEALRLLGVIRNSARKMGKLIDDLLKFSRLGRKPVQGVAVDMRGLVEEAQAEILVDAKRSDAQIIVETMPDSPGDRALLKQVWLNLLGNALKYSSQVSQPRIRVGGHTEGSENIYCVRDNGVGFDMRYAHKLFEVFQRLHGEEEFAGTGVGLAIVKRIIVRHGGRVWAESETGKGTSFFFSLPKEGLGL